MYCHCAQMIVMNVVNSDRPKKKKQKKNIQFIKYPFVFTVGKKKPHTISLLFSPPPALLFFAVFDSFDTREKSFFLKNVDNDDNYSHKKNYLYTKDIKLPGLFEISQLTLWKRVFFLYAPLRINSVYSCCILSFFIFASLFHFVFFFSLFYSL